MGRSLDDGQNGGPVMKKGEEYPCTECGGDAFIAYSAKKNGDWGGLVKPGERICLPCGKRRGINFFGKGRS